MTEEVGTSVLGELPLIPEVSEGGDRGTPFMLAMTGDGTLSAPSVAWKSVMNSVADRLWKSFGTEPT